MAMEEKVAGPRMSAEERRAAVLAAATAEFAATGLHGTSTEAIAARAGISQPYIFRLFGTKKDLFIAVVEHVYGRIATAFRAAAEQDPAHALEHMGDAYTTLLTQRDELLVLLHSFAASADPDIQRVVRARYAELYRYVEGVADAPVERVRGFFATGMLLTVAAAIDLPSLLGEEWARHCLGVDAAAPGREG